MGKILVIDDEEHIGWIIKKTFEGTDNTVYSALTGQEGIELLKKQTFNLVFLDLRLTDTDGMEILVEIKKLRSETAVIVITAHGSIDTAIESMKKGAFDYLTKPFDLDELMLQAQKAMEVERLKDEVSYLREEAAKELDESLFKSSNRKMAWIYSSLEQVAASNATVLITGESGTGKELIARRIHKLSDRRNYPFVVFNCASLPEETLESELFGEITGLSENNYGRKIGRFELAHKGTIFLDEVGEMNLNVQAKLLRVFEEKEFQRLGENSSIKMDIRIIAATNKDLKEAIAMGEFREDFYYRLNVIPIELPPLRERKEDISDLIDLFIKKYDIHKKVSGISPEAIKLLRNYNWPGNIREIQNVIERIIILNKDKLIKAENLPIEILDQRKKSKEPIIYFPEEGINLEEVEKELIIKALKISGQNQTKAAQLLGITRSALLYRMQKYQL